MKRGNFFTAHLRAINKSYFQHLKDAMIYGLRMIIGGLGAIIHAIFPFLFDTVGSGTVNELHKKNINPFNRDIDTKS